MEIICDPDTLAAGVDAPVANRGELRGIDRASRVFGIGDVRHRNALGAEIEGAVDELFLNATHADNRRCPPHIAGAAQVADVE